MDRGFYSEENINSLYKEHIKFLMCVKLSLKFVANEFKTSRDIVRAWNNYNPDYDLFCLRADIQWNYVQERPYKGDEVHEKRRLYLYLYYNAQKAADEERTFALRMATLSEELKTGKRVVTNERAYAKYFDIKITPVRGTKIIAKEEAMYEAKKNFGYFALISNDAISAVKAIEIYRNKNLIEKVFCNIKDCLDCRRLLVSSELSLNGKLFVEFIALIYLSYIKNRMQLEHIFRHYTMQGLLDTLDVIECYEHSKSKTRIGEMTEKQKALFIYFGSSLLHSYNCSRI